LKKMVDKGDVAKVTDKKDTLFYLVWEKGAVLTALFSFRRRSDGRHCVDLWVYVQIAQFFSLNAPKVCASWFPKTYWQILIFMI
jgi:hypothetical protein